VLELRQGRRRESQGAMNASARMLLAQAAQRATTLTARDDRWPAATELSRAGLVRVRPVTRQTAEVTITDAGRAAIAGGAA
jgi:hypothetical protein